MDYTFHCTSPLGGITLASDGDALIGLWFDGQRYFGNRLSQEREQKQLHIFDNAAKWLDVYFSKKVPDFTPALNMRTTPFRKSVWEIMLRSRTDIQLSTGKSQSE